VQKLDSSSFPSLLTHRFDQDATERFRYWTHETATCLKETSIRRTSKRLAAESDILLTLLLPAAVAVRGSRVGDWYPLARSDQTVECRVSAGICYVPGTYPQIQTDELKSRYLPFRRVPLLCDPCHDTYLLLQLSCAGCASFIIEALPRLEPRMQQSYPEGIGGACRQSDEHEREESEG
jgi:hypothetical protein